MRIAPMPARRGVPSGCPTRRPALRSAARRANTRRVWGRCHRKRTAHDQLLHLSRQLGRGAAGGRHLHQEQRRPLRHQVPEAPTGADGQRQQNGSPAGRARRRHGHPRSRRDVGTRVRRCGLDPRVDGRQQGAGGGRHAQGAPRDRELQGQALCRPLQQQHASCSGTAPTWCRRHPRRGTR